MSTESDETRSAGSKWPVAVSALVLLLLLLLVGAWAWRRYDPFYTSRPAVRDAQALIDTARHRPLTDAEFDAAVGLLGADEPAARLAAVAVSELQAGRSAERKRRVVSALTEAERAADPAFGRSVSQALTRPRAGEPGR